MYTLIEAVRLIGLLITPFMPSTGAKIATILGQSAAGSPEWGGLRAGTIVAKAEPLFPRIEAE
jgi:methionyl-tRNA synthetase